MRQFPGTILSLLLSLVVSGFLPCGASGTEQPHVSQVVITIRGMICSSCGKEIEKSLKKLDGVGAVRVDLPSDRATVSYDERKVTPRQLADAIRKAGYEALLPAEPPLSPPKGR